MSIVDPLKFLFALALFSIGLQLFGCQAGFMNNYDQPWPEEVSKGFAVDFCYDIDNIDADYQSESIKSLCSIRR